ncbi:MAG: M23 family metallopeptidase [Leptolyngbyaceae cyanobacterium RM1_1_2]|nr:M23 family metallopeptidase [Leptolyngbyaceae cyanobacterium RM1_1_2]
MRRRIPERYTVLVARTGREPLTLNFRPLPAILLALVLAGTPLIWLGLTVSTLVRSNLKLATENQNLAETATEVLINLDSLDAEVSDLRQRAGLSPEASTQSSTRVPQGGIPEAASTQTLFHLAKQRLPVLEKNLKAQVKPALEQTLAAEAAAADAYPDGLPLKGHFEVTSEFGLRRNPFGRLRYELHQGIDLKGPYGASIYATASGMAKQAENSGGYGNHVILDHGYGYQTLYGHLSGLAVKVGDRVERGQIIGYLGNTGRSSGPHLHYEVHQNGKSVNPRGYLPLGDGAPASLSDGAPASLSDWRSCILERWRSKLTLRTCFMFRRRQGEPNRFTYVGQVVIFRVT